MAAEEDPRGDPVRVVIADDSMLVRGPRPAARRRRLEVVGTAANGEELLRLVARASRTSRSSTSGCRRARPTRGSGRPRDPRPATRRRRAGALAVPRAGAMRSQLLHRVSGTRATCSRSASLTSPCCGRASGSPTESASRPDDRVRLVHRRASPGRSTSSPTANERCWRSWPRDARTGDRGGSRDAEDRRGPHPPDPPQARPAESPDDHRRVLAVLAYLRS